ncbi:hypothetical protein ACUXOD_003791 [Bacillus sp. 153480037-1]
MKKCMLYLNKLDLKKLHKELGSVNRIGRAVRTYLVREYELPTNEEGLVEMLTYRPGENGEITGFGLSESALAKMDETVETLRKLEKNNPVLFRKGNRSGRVDDFYSLIIRDVIKKMVDRMESGSYSYEIESRRFYIPEDIVLQYRGLYQSGFSAKIELIEELENYIIQDYNSEITRSVDITYKEKTQRLRLTLDKAAFKKVTDAKVASDILINFIQLKAPK